ncbi:FUSC family protein [Deinococcus sonorensis]|uniref:FUSC family protein n=2 Tax=Deinococcus sonorensis TaxID=309891 RepID=A0AAU7U5G0_9DEIO
MRKWRPYSALRSSVGLALPVVWAGLTGHTAWGVLAANGAMNAALPSMNSVPRRRIQVMLGVSASTALLGMLGVLVGQNILACTLVMTVLGMLLTVYGAAGPANFSVGVSSTTTFIVLTGLHLPPSAAPLSGLLILAGGLLQTVLLVVVWPIRPRRLERSAVAQVYHAQAALLAELPDTLSALPEAQSLQDAWAVLGEIRAQGWTDEHAALRHALRIAEGTRAALVGYVSADAECREQGHPLLAQQTGEVLAQALRQVEGSVRLGQPSLSAPTLARLNQQYDDLRHSPAGGLTRWTGLILNLLRELNRPQMQADAPRALAAAPSVWSALVKVPPLKWDSPVTRHAVTYGLLLGLLTLATRLLQVPHGYWLVLTAAVVLRQEYTTTLTRGVARLGGTATGVLAAELITLLVHPAAPHLAWWSLLGAFLAFALFPTGYAAFSAALTLYVVCAVAASGVAESTVIGLRLALTLLGGALALGAALLSPTGPSNGTREALRDAVSAQIKYLKTLRDLRRHTTAGAIAAASDARAHARERRLQAERTVQASRLEPRRRRRATPAALSGAQAQTYLQRLTENAALGLTLHASAVGRSRTQADPDLNAAIQSAHALLDELEGQSAMTETR